MALIYLIPSLLDEEGEASIPPYVLSAIKECQVFFAENERTTRRYFKMLWREMIIDNYEWYDMSDQGKVAVQFNKKIAENKIIGIISEAGTPGIADPGQELVRIAHEKNVQVKPLVGPNSIILALMSSGMNGQQFQFVGYLPIDSLERTKAIKHLEAESAKKNCTQIFIETPYRNNQLVEAIIKNCAPSTLFCIATKLTGPTESIKTKTIGEWKKENIDLHKQPSIFLLYSPH
jgi:16S rRNA (cytidine1402-2'-O)-methyltransferase